MQKKNRRANFLMFFFKKNGFMAFQPIRFFPDSQVHTDNPWEGGLGHNQEHTRAWTGTPENFLGGGDPHHINPRGRNCGAALLGTIPKWSCWCKQNQGSGKGFCEKRLLPQFRSLHDHIVLKCSITKVPGKEGHTDACLALKKKF